MGQQPPSHASASSPIGERVEAFVREHLQRCILALVAEEITARLGRPTSAVGALRRPRRGCGMATARPGG